MQQPLNIPDFNSFYTWFVLVAFIITIFFIIVAPKIPIFLPKFLFPRKKNENATETTHLLSHPLNEEKSINISEPIETTKFFKFHVSLDFSVIPLFWIIIFIILGIISLEDCLVSGLLGKGLPIQPYTVMLFCMALNYICISLDTTGVFTWLARQMIERTKDRGILLYLVTCAFAAILTAMTTNDIVILTLTPVTCYLAKAANNIDPIPFCITQFFLANILSITLMTGNPTNIIVAEANQLNFLQYSGWMAFPAIIAAIVAFILLFLTFYKRIPAIIERKIIENDRGENVFLIGAIIKIFGLLSCLISLIIGSFFVKGFYIACGFAFLFLVIDIICDLINAFKKYQYFEQSIIKRVFIGLPWKIIPFMVGMFIFVHVLRQIGWISFFAKHLSFLINKVGGVPGDGFISRLRGIGCTILIMAYITIFSCQFLNNQPMTIVFTYILKDASFLLNTPEMMRVAKFGLILGANLGANITIIGALSGIMWQNILKGAGISSKQMNYWKFLMYGLSITPIVLLFPSIVLFFEEWIVYHFIDK